MATIDGIDITSLTLQEGAAPSTPAATKWKVYAKTDGLYYIDDAGTETGPLAAAAAGSFDPDVHMPWHISLVPMIWTPDASVGTWALSGSNSALTGAFASPNGTGTTGQTGWRNTSAALNDYSSWDVVLAAGTWNLSIWSLTGASFAICTVKQDGTSIGTIDFYSAATAFAKQTITGFTVATTGKKRFQFIAASKNASSSSYNMWMMAIEFRRTA